MNGEECCLLHKPRVDFPACLFFDCLHDFLEGIFCYALAFLLTFARSDYGLREADFNNAFANCKFDKLEKHEGIPLGEITYNNGKMNLPNFTAAQMRIFATRLPFILAALLGENSPFFESAEWKCYCLLLKIYSKF